jgi:hypothetical protein
MDRATASGAVGAGSNPAGRVFSMHLIFLLLSVLAFSGAAFPQKDKTLLFIGQDRDTIGQYARETEHKPEGVMLYTSVQKAEGLKGPANVGGVYQDGPALLAAYPRAALQIGLYTAGALDPVNAGTYDANLDFLAQWIKRTKRPVYLRIGYEFDNPENGYQPEKYKQAFKRIVDLFRKKGVSNTAFVWHSYNWGEKDPMDWYPGDDYVDWFAVSIFSTQQFADALRLKRLARDHGKEFMVGESSPSGTFSVMGKLDWYKKMFRFISEHDVKAYSYINCNWNNIPMFKSLNWGDARVEQMPAVKAFWLEQINRPRFKEALEK